MSSWQPGARRLARHGAIVEHVLPARAMTFQQLQRDVKLAAAGVDRNCVKQPCKGLRNPGVMRKHSCVRVASRLQNLRAKGDKIAGCRIRIQFESRDCLHRLVVEVEPARLDKGCQTSPLQRVLGGGRDQGPSHRVPRRLAAALLPEHDIVPPLQANLSSQWPARRFAYPGNFKVEGV